MKPNDRTAAPEIERGAAPEVFSSVLGLLIEYTADLLRNSELSEEKEATERRRLAILKLADASNLPFEDFHTMLFALSPSVERQFADQLETLSALYDVCCKPRAV